MTKTRQMPAQFRWFESYSIALDRIPDEQREQRAQLALAIAEYGAWGTEPDFGSNWGLASAFEALRPNIDVSVGYYLKGKKGGRPKKNKKPALDTDALADAYSICAEPIPDEVLDAQAQYMSDEYMREREELQKMAEAQAWIG